MPLVATVSSATPTTTTSRGMDRRRQRRHIGFCCAGHAAFIRGICATVAARDRALLLGTVLHDIGLLLFSGGNGYDSMESETIVLVAALPAALERSNGLWACSGSMSLYLTCDVLAKDTFRTKHRSWSHAGDSLHTLEMDTTLAN
jgi:hypothetical protein